MAWTPLPVQPPLDDSPAPPPAQGFWRRLWAVLAPHDTPHRDWGHRTRHDLAHAGK
jgi:hypothetical protein